MADQPDPLRQLISMGDDFRSNVESMMREGTSSIRAALPELPKFPLPTRNGKASSGGLPSPAGILAKLPKLPSLPGSSAEPARPTSTPRPITTRQIPPTPPPRAGGYQLRNTVQHEGYTLRV